MKHLAIFSGNAAELILSGQKTIESRLSNMKLPPFGVVSAGDFVYIKPSGKEIIGDFRVKKVIFIDGLEKDDIKELKEKYGLGIAMNEEWWKTKENAKYATIIFIGNSNRYLTSPIKFPKKDLRGWVVLD